MTFREFKRQIYEISREEFKGFQSHPLDHGIERTHFEEERLRRLIALGRKANFGTARRHVESWERQLGRVQETRQRLQNTKAGIFPPGMRTQENKLALSAAKSL